MDMVISYRTGKSLTIAFIILLFKLNSQSIWPVVHDTHIICGSYGSYEQTEYFIWHPAIDIACSAGDKVVAIESGTVTEVTQQNQSIYVRIQSDNHTVSYGHIDQLLPSDEDYNTLICLDQFSLFLS